MMMMIRDGVVVLSSQKELLDEKRSIDAMVFFGRRITKKPNHQRGVVVVVVPRMNAGPVRWCVAPRRQ